MELRHLRCFLAVAEELHFARAAERLHIEQSPLSRAIKELEEELGTQLFLRTTRSTRLTHAGRLFLEHVPRVFTALQQARDSVKAVANGYCGQLRVALSDGISPLRFSSFLALCRQEDRRSRFACLRCRCRSRSRDCMTIFMTWGSPSRTRSEMASLLFWPGASHWWRRCLSAIPSLSPQTHFVGRTAALSTGVM